MKNKKVGIVSCYFKHNYGSMLQAYATQKILDDMGIENETINIDENIDFSNGKKKYYISQITNISFIKSKLGMVKLKLDKKIKRKLGKNISIRDKKYKEFEKNFNLTKPYRTYEELTKKCSEYSSVLVGSDQLWLPVNVIADYYTLNWVPDNVNKISYATSFGVSSIPAKYEEKYKKFLNRINYLSTREVAGQNIIKELTTKKAMLVCDPTLLVNKEEWMSIQKEERIIKEKYIFCYFLGKNIEHRKFAERLREKTGYKIVSLNHADEYVRYSDKFADETPYDVGPAEFLNMIRNAEYVCTDSFHGTVFSLINNVKFFTFRRYSNKSKVSTNSRIDSLLGIVNLKDRLLVGDEDIEDEISKVIDFDNVNLKLDEFRKKSKEFLNNALKENIKIQEEDNKKKHIDIQDKSKCCGCTACMSICPKGAITMKEDNEGFLYPNVNMEKCVNCGVCKKVCPVLNTKEERKDKHTYIFQHSSDKVRRESTSGGAFTAIAEYVIDNGGVVFGATFDEEFNVINQGINKKEELYKFRNSKYVQSNPLNTFSEVKNLLTEGRMVCYSGTSCQIEGLKRFLNKEYDNLILVDVVCRAVPSPLIWRKYLKLRKEKYKDIKQIMFRDKYYGYKYSNLSIYNKTGDKKQEYHSGVDSDPYLRAFFSNICDRPACYKCKFKKDNRESDITIWDCFDVEKYDKTFDDDKGTTRVMTNTVKGEKIICEIAKENKCKEIDVEKATKGFLAMYQPVKYNFKREEFFDDAKTLSDKELFNKYFPDTMKVKLERNTRKILLRTGVYKKVLSLGKKVRKRD